MYEIALILSIITSILVIIYLLMLIFRRNEDQNTITIQGRIVTKKVTVTEVVNDVGRTIDQK